MKTIQNNDSLANIVLSAPHAAMVFGRNGLDYCCGGNQPLAEACSKAGLDAGMIVKEIQAEHRSEEPMQKWDDRSLGQLVAYVLDKHHVYTKSALKDLKPLMEKVDAVHGHAHPELHELKKLLRQLKDDLDTHLEKEEQVLFPFIVDLDSENPAMPPFGSLAHPIRMMNMEHQTDGEILQRMQVITGGFAIAPGACASYRALYINLKTLVEDLMRHIHFETHLLFPRALAREQEIRSR